MLAMGNPARIVRELTDQEIKANLKNADDYVKMAEESD